MNYIDMRPFKDASEIEYVRGLAKQDEHELFFPSFVITKGSLPLGYIGMAPAVMGWLDRRRMKARDSLDTMRLMENHIKTNGGRGLFLPMPDQSELLPSVKPMGYLEFGKVNLFVKGF